ncbi:unnamed protein product [Vitrella brassicaformis CCMP3155]|uniref:Uncharacterized protein n=2 Tax=Vitrella brassicaformis TaxID=1169539 RepID=A0A0G4FHY2_VITBC|nr:unnamed protein product [Vitrella brassicaformis CCMP3155]|eukprot:CEM12709.1 unnamed protein product [Vitrella brassicaformis CCMP3155]
MTDESCRPSTSDDGRLRRDGDSRGGSASSSTLTASSCTTLAVALVLAIVALAADAAFVPPAAHISAARRTSSRWRLSRPAVDHHGGVPLACLGAVDETERDTSTGAQSSPAPRRRRRRVAEEPKTEKAPLVNVWDEDADDDLAAAVEAERAKWASLPSRAQQQGQDEGWMTKARDSLSTILVVDFFVVLVFVLWFVFGTIANAAFNAPAAIQAFDLLWTPVVQPALGILMLGTLGSAGAGWVQEKMVGGKQEGT